MTPLTLALLIYGIAILISFLVALLMKSMYLVMNSFERRQAHVSESEPLAMPTEVETPSPELIAILSAAATTTLGKKARITRVQYRSTRPSAGWTTQGRMTIMTSHTTKR